MSKKANKMDAMWEQPSLADFLKYYGHRTYCANCSEHDSCYIRKGVKAKGLYLKCENCGCLIDL